MSDQYEADGDKQDNRKMNDEYRICQQAVRCCFIHR